MVSGTAAAPIVIAAAEERRALISTHGKGPGLSIRNCSNVRMDGLVIQGADADLGASAPMFPLVEVLSCHQVALTKLLVSTTNRYVAAQAMLVDTSDDVLLEDGELYSFHQFGLHILQGARITVRRWYVNSRGYADLPGGVVTNNPGRGDYGIASTTKDVTYENCISEGNDVGLLESGDGTQRLLGSVSLSDRIGLQAQLGSDHVHENVAVLGASTWGVYVIGVNSYSARGATIIGAPRALVSDSMTSDAAAPLTFTNTLMLLGSGQIGTEFLSTPRWVIEYTNLYPDTYPPSGDGGVLRNSLAVDAVGIGAGANRCLVYVPSGSNMKGAGKDGGDIGADVIHRYQDGVLTSTPLWDPTTGAFPCGAIVAGINDTPGISCFDVHQRLRVNGSGCPLP
jgi:hypothetical protein